MGTDGKYPTYAGTGCRNGVQQPSPLFRDTPCRTISHASDAGVAIKQQHMMNEAPPAFPHYQHRPLAVPAPFRLQSQSHQRHLSPLDGSLPLDGLTAAPFVPSPLHGFGDGRVQQQQAHGLPKLSLADSAGHRTTPAGTFMASTTPPPSAAERQWHHHQQRQRQLQPGDEDDEDDDDDETLAGGSGGSETRGRAAAAAAAAGDTSSESRPHGQLSSRIVVDPPQLAEWREKLFNVEGTLVLTHDE